MSSASDWTTSDWPSRTLTVGDVDLVVHDSGGDGPAVLLLHGLAGHAFEWWPVVSRLVRTHRVIAFDQRGHGGSTRRPGDVSRDAFVAEVLGVVEALDCAPVLLVGQSMGAHTALLTAAARPDVVRGLVLVEGGVGGGGEAASTEATDWFRGWPLPFPDRAAAVEFFGGGVAGQAWAAGLAETSDGLVPRFDVEVLQRAILAVHAEERWAEWEAVEAPVLLVAAEHGPMVEEMRRMVAAQPHARLVEVAGASHDVHLEAADRIAEEIRGWAGA